MSEIKHKSWKNWLLFFATVIIVFFLGMLASSITERRAEEQFTYKPTVIISENESRNEVWGKNFPLEYTSYMQTADTSFYSKYNGNGIIDMLEVDPRLVLLWDGYAFSKDYKQSRGHFYAMEDIWQTLRTGAPKGTEDGPQSATCWTCKSPDVPRLMNTLGIAEFYTGKWAGKGTEMYNIIGCLDCHDPESMELTITRPALVEAYERQGKNIEDATHEEMRSLVCAQCHVEYYFDKHKVDGANYLTFPWDNGNSVEDIIAYYDTIQFADWTHTMSKAPMLKAQHPDYEVFTTGIHYERGVSCADCHMPYKTEGGQKYTDHHIQSPLNNIANSCQVCHREETEELIANVYDRQDKIIENRDKLEILLVRAHLEAKTAWDNGAVENQMTAILQDIRHAQFKWDFVAAGHGNSFHSPIEMSRVLASGIETAQEARIKLAKLLPELGFTGEVAYPDIDTKEKAQIFIGLDIKKLTSEKQVFIDSLLPTWKKAAEDRQATWEIVYY